MTLLKTISERTDNKGVPYTDLYLGWRDEEGVKVVRVRNVFGFDRFKLEKTAVVVPTGEALGKYID